jgi:hypothetical protein
MTTQRIDDRSRRVLIRFAVGAVWLTAFTFVPHVAGLGSLRDGVAMLSTLCALSGLCRMAIAILAREPLGPSHLNSWDEAAGFYAMSVLARMVTGVMG